MQSQESKHAGELDVFRAFVRAAHLPIVSESIRHQPEYTNEPDILCSVAGTDQYFELSEVLWEMPDKPGETLAKGHHQSDEAARLKSQLIAQGKTDEAHRILTSGQFGYPPLLSFEQSLERKIAKSYALHDRPCSLLLYYARQRGIEPYDLLFECTDMLITLLVDAPFKVVWLYEHSLSNSISLDLGSSGSARIAVGQPVALSQFRTPENAVIGRIALDGGRLSMAFDSHYSQTFYAELRALNAAIAASREI